MLEVFTEKEIKHIGEELADVFIYSTRLCDICNIDLPAFVRSCAGLPASGPVWSTNINSLAIWSNLSFDDLHKSSRLNVRSVRELVLELHLEVGRICELFNSRSETMNRYGLVDWTDTERKRLSTTIATVCMILATIADMVKLSLASCITDKFAKNDAKYPVDLVRGKSGKYTEYVEKIKQQQKSFVVRAFENAFSNNNLNVLLLCCLSIACGYIGGKRTMMNM